jgi:CheY-like chemotaxis protein
MQSLSLAHMPSVLVVDDTRGAAEALQLLFEAHGYHARCAFDGQQGLDAARGERADFVILDIDLPSLGGCDVARLLRNCPEFRYAPIVALSGHVGKQHVDGAIEAGFDKYFYRPVKFQALHDYLMSFR